MIIRLGAHAHEPPKIPGPYSSVWQSSCPTPLDLPKRAKVQVTSAPRRCYASLKWIGDDPQQHQQNQEHNNDADNATNAISRSRCGAPIAIATAAIEATAIAKSAEQNDDDNNQHEGAHDSPPNAFFPGRSIHSPLEHLEIR